MTTQVESMQEIQRHCRDAVDCLHDDDDSDLQNRKKMRLPADGPQLVSPEKMSDGENSEESKAQRQDESSPSPPRQWWFSRLSPTTPGAETNTAASKCTPLHVGNDSGMVLSENLGVTSDVVESLTHDVENWSLTRLSPATISTASSTVGSNETNSKQKKEKQKQCKEAQRQVRMARRQYLEAQKRLFVSSADATAID